ncbi:hypothetical protein COV19_03545, partial [Candidatus Woesearchaeota archaeon CG10_big_fil_rev_8_21_14_0_10_44_13]
MIGMIKVLMLDYGGVTGRWIEDAQISNICRIYGVKERFARGLYGQNGLYSLYEQGKITSRDLHERLCRKSGKKLPYKRMAGTLDGVYKDNHEVVLLLKKIKQKSDVRLALAENTSSKDLRWQRKNLDSIRLFDSIFISEKAKTYKKNPEFFKKCLKTLKVNPNEVLFFDDKKENVESAKKAGIRGFLFSNVREFKKIIEKEMLNKNNKN